MSYNEAYHNLWQGGVTISAHSWYHQCTRLDTQTGDDIIAVIIMIIILIIIVIIIISPPILQDILLSSSMGEFCGTTLNRFLSIQLLYDPSL